MSITTEKLYIRLWIGNLGKYNEGELIGEWFDLPCDMEEVAERIGLNEEYEEWQINDFETNISGLSIHHYDNVEKLNEFAEQLEQLEDHELVIANAYIQEFGIDEFMSNIDSFSDDAIVFHDCNDMSDVAYQWYEESGQLAELEKYINSSYIDFEAIGRDMAFDGTYVFLDDCCIQFLH